MKKYNKTVISYYEKFLDGENFEVYALDNGKYIDIHVISERFKDDKLNTLKLQEPKQDLMNTCKNLSSYKDYFNKDRMIGFLLEHFIWDRFYNEGIFSGYVVSSFDKHE